jgi:DNA-binding transcriptional ArsR family regulator
MTAHEDARRDVQRHDLDYDIEDVVVVSTNSQLKAIADDTRMHILNLLMECSATVTQLPKALEKPKGTIGHHTKVLEDAGMIRIVRTNKVRAITEKYYGRTGRTILLEKSPKPDDPMWFINDALRGLRNTEGEPLPMFTSRVARIPMDLAVEFSHRIMELAEEFTAMPRSGETVYGFLTGIYPTDQPGLSDEQGPDD